MYKIFDNYLTDEEFTPLQQRVNSVSFPWFFHENDTREYRHKNIFHFGHNFYSDIDGGQVSSEDFILLKPLLDRLHIKTLIRAKAILKTKQEKIYKSEPHIDREYDCKVALFYINSTNGYTGIGNDKVECIKNRLVTFKSNVEHFATNCTNHKQRITININYF